MPAAFASGFAVVPYPELPLENVYVDQPFSRGLRSKHTADLFLVANIVGGFVLFLAAPLLLGPFGALLLIGIGNLLVTISTLDIEELWSFVPPTSILFSPPEISQEAAHIAAREITTTLFSSAREVAASIFLGLANLGNAISRELATASALFSGAVAALAGIYQLGKQRFSTVDVFSSEIAARMRILAADNSVGRIIGNANGDSLAAKAPSSASNGKTYEPSEEDQFEIFHQRSSDLGALSSSVVDHVTAFYSFHRAARDELRDLLQALGNGAPETELRDLVINVLFMVDLMAYNGLKSLDDLVETPEHNLHCRQICLCVGTPANAHLIEHMPPGDHRYAEVRARNASYAEYVRELKSELKRTGLATKGRDFF